MSSHGGRCSVCGEPFQIGAQEREIRERVAPSFAGRRFPFPAPALCAECRYRRRLAYRNEWCLYHRKCDATGRQIISIYSADKPYRVFASEYWWSDAWDGLAYGREFDFNRPFFEQFAELRREVPRLCITNSASENCEYTNQASHNRDCYLIVASNKSERCLYGNWYQKCYACVDCYALEACEHCYECMNSSGLHTCLFVRSSENCHDCLFCGDCHSCGNLIGCQGLWNQSYCIFNEKVSRKEWERFRDELQLTPPGIAEFEGAVRAKLLQTPRKYYTGKSIEDSSGDYLQECKNTSNAFNARYCRDVAHVQDAWEAKDCFDLTETLTNQCCGELEGCAFLDYAFALSKVWSVPNAYYSELCFNSHDLFGCIGLKKNEYCILNRQYSASEYQALAARIADHMQRGGEWGEFFPAAHAPFGYNESVAAEYYPLTSRESAALGFRWHAEEAAQKHYLGPRYRLAERIGDVPDEIVQQILLCEVSGRPYKVLPMELEFYRRMGLPAPRRSPQQRRADRMRLRNPRRLIQKPCAQCGASLYTSYAENCPERVMCEECYNSLR